VAAQISQNNSARTRLQLS